MNVDVASCSCARERGPGEAIGSSERAIGWICEKADPTGQDLLRELSFYVEDCAGPLAR